MAPKQTRNLAAAAVMKREIFRVLDLSPDTAAATVNGWDDVIESMDDLLSSMRNDLGLEVAADDVDALTASDDLLTPEAQASEPPEARFG